MGERYGMLPSEVLARATTLDLKCLDVAVSWNAHKDGRSTAPKLSVDQMQELLNKTKAMYKK